jgi:hypothetical protein
MGKVVDSQRSQEFAGTVDQPGAVINGRRITNDGHPAVYATQQILVIEGESRTPSASGTVRSIQPMLPILSIGEV